MAYRVNSLLFSKMFPNNKTIVVKLYEWVGLDKVRASCQVRLSQGEIKETLFMLIMRGEDLVDKVSSLFFFKISFN